MTSNDGRYLSVYYSPEDSRAKWFSSRNMPQIPEMPLLDDDVHVEENPQEGTRAMRERHRWTPRLVDL